MTRNEILQSRYNNAYFNGKHESAAAIRELWDALEQADEVKELKELTATLECVESRFCAVLEKVTGGRMSKANYALEAMLPVIDDFLTKVGKEAVDELMKDLLRDAAERDAARCFES